MADNQDAIALLKADHRAVEALFEKYEGAKGDGAKQRIALEICLELTVHAQIEEEIFYPACEGKIEEDLHIAVAEVDVDHLCDGDRFRVLDPSPMLGHLLLQLEDGERDIASNEP